MKISFFSCWILLDLFHFITKETTVSQPFCLNFITKQTTVSQPFCLNFRKYIFCLIILVLKCKKCCKTHIKHAFVLCNIDQREYCAYLLNLILIGIYWLISLCENCQGEKGQRTIFDLRIWLKNKNWLICIIL